ncbi:MAG TPA: enoyl-CoA hydratase-related protein [Acidobacteriaceae bacterium]|jgi:enoyl-CoA hydratase|nr:enoyl-CoA hydratase-related protein [Acidobacteriaceae bacterium]
MAYETLLLERSDAYAVVTLNRPKVMNALNRALFTDLEDAFTTLAGDSTVRAVILTGSGDKAFAAGADISELATLSATDGQQFARRGQGVFRRIETCGKPVIAAIQGFALGGGCELAMACTIRIASEHARLGQPEVKLGLVPGYGGTQRLPRLVGKGAALKLLLTGDMVGAEEAFRIGLVDEVVPAEALMPRAETLARAIAQQAPLAITGCLRAVEGGYDLPIAAGLELEASLFGLACATEDKAEGTRAFLEKRAPAWQGR